MLIDLSQILKDEIKIIPALSNKSVRIIAEDETRDITIYLPMYLTPENYQILSKTAETLNNILLKSIPLNEDIDKYKKDTA